MTRSGSTSQPKKLTTRIAEWSAAHRKTAVFGWLAFVVASVAIGGSLGTRTLSGAELSTGETQRAELALERAGLTPNSEMVLIQNPDQTAGSPGFSAVIDEVTAGLDRSRYV